MKNVEHCVNCDLCDVDRIALSWCRLHRKVVNLNEKCKDFVLKKLED